MHRGFSHIGLSTLDLDKTRRFYEGVLGFKAVVADTIKIEEGGYLRHLFFAAFYHFAFEAGSDSALADKRDELRAKGVEVTDIADHGWAKSIYFKDPNGLSLEYCCVVRDFTQDDATMQGRFTVRRAALDLDNAVGAKVFEAQSVHGNRQA